MLLVFEPDDIEILQGIVEEASEHLNGIEEGILKLEAEYDQDQLNSVFRALHSVKGVASFVDFVPIKDTAHVLESMLSDMKKDLYCINAEITDLLLKGVDILNLLIKQLDADLHKLGANLPVEAFELNIDDLDYQIFVTEAEETRAKNSGQINEEAGEPGSCQVTSYVKEDAQVMKIELNTFAEQATNEFLEEIMEHLDTIESNCVELEKYPGHPELIDAILRGFHSIKGGAGVILSMTEQEEGDSAFHRIKHLTHAVESLLQNYRHQAMPLSSEIIDIILTSVDKTATLVETLRNHEVELVSVENLIKRISSLTVFSVSSAVEGQSSIKVTDLPKQLNAFVNVNRQALDSMSKIISAITTDRPVNLKRLKQYIRALQSIASSSRYLQYDDVLIVAEQNINYLETLKPDQDLITTAVADSIRTGHEKISGLIKARIDKIQKILTDVPSDYIDKKLGEILVAENKISQNELDAALAKQKKLGEILIDSGITSAEDIEEALTRQTIAKETSKETSDQHRVSTDINSQSIRVSQDKMNRLMNMIGELLISRNRVFHLANTINLDYNLPPLARDVKSVAAEISRIADELQNAIMSARMLPLRGLFQRFPRTIRDISRKAGKIAELTIDGEDTELDKTVIEAINDPLVHMLRNAVDHGLETPEERKQVGKDPCGNISLKARYQGNYVVIEIADDGKGLNPHEIKAKALKKGLISPDQIETMSNEEAYQLIFQPGFSTKETVSELSGRGVGMDVVKNNIQQVGGSIRMSTNLQVGTRFTLKIPLSMSIIKGLMVTDCGQKFVIPLDSIEETVKIRGSVIRRYKNLMVADIRGEILHLSCLKDALGICNDEKKSVIDNRVSIVVINADGNKFGIIVDSFQKEQEFVVKSLTEELALLRIYTGASILGDGSIILIINPAQLYAEIINAK